MSNHVPKVLIRNHRIKVNVEITLHVEIFLQITVLE